MRWPRRASASPRRTLKEWIEAVNASPAAATLRARLAARLLRERRLREAEEQLDACLALCPHWAPSRKRLLVAVLRVRTRAAARRRELLSKDPRGF